MKTQEIAFRSFDNAGEMIDALESLIDCAKACQAITGSKLTGYEINVDVRFELGENGIDLASLNEETLTDGSKVYNILLG